MLELLSVVSLVLRLKIQESWWTDWPNFFGKIFSHILENSAFLPFLKKTASNMPTWPKLSSLTGGADKKLLTKC